MSTEVGKRASPAQEAWELFYELFARQRPRMLAIQAEYGLTPPQFIAMQSLDDPTPMGKVAGVLNCDSSNLTWITDRLEERGFVERRSDPTDRRVKLLVLTDEGRRVRDEVRARLAVPPEALATLSVAEQRQLRDLLRKTLAA